MDNIFYAPPDWFHQEYSVQIQGQEAQHISKVLRRVPGDSIEVANGAGDIFSCEIAEITRQTVTARCVEKHSQHIPQKKKILALGTIKKRDRLEFAVEKAVELGAWEICLFDADHSERSKINTNRVEAIIVSAFKQSGRYWLPKFVFKRSLDKVLEYYGGHKVIMAHEKTSTDQHPQMLSSAENLLLVGPEGGFSEREVGLTEENGGEFISLGKNRLRAETAVTAILSQYLFDS